MKHIKLYESFDEDQTWYHGAGRADKDFVKAMNHVGAKDANDEQGPGLYLTTSEKDASKYGVHIYKIKLNNTERRVITDDDELTYDDMKIARDLIKKYSAEWEMEAQNYNEDPEEGLDQFLHGAQLDASKVKDFYISVWYGFFRHNGVDFVKGMSEMGIDAIITAAYRGQAAIWQGEDDLHAIVYNPDIIKVIGK